MKLPRYENYKDSDVEWLGEIPEHWKFKKLKHLLHFQTGGTPSSGNEKLYDGNLPWVSISDLKYKIITTTKATINNQGIIAARIPKTPKGSLLFSFKLSIGQVGFAGVDLYTNEAIASFLENKNQSLNYWFYALPIFLPKNANKNIYDALLLNASLIKNALILAPPIAEQKRIAEFLDRKCGEIDEAISKKQRLIELLEEQKTILINQAVTKGLDPNVPMKDSGIEWLGEIPEHWKNQKIKCCCKIFRGKFTHRPRNDPKLYDGIYPFVQTGDIAKAGKFLTTFNQTLNEKGLRVSTLIPKGTVLITIAANIGDISILDFDSCFPDSVVGFNPSDEIERDFLYYVLCAMKQQFINSSTQNTQMNLNVERIGNNFIAIPEILEQRKIVNQIESILFNLEKTQKATEKQIEKLTELKQIFIAEAVTGKIKI